MIIPRMSANTIWSDPPAKRSKFRIPAQAELDKNVYKEMSQNDLLTNFKAAASTTVTFKIEDFTAAEGDYIFPHCQVANSKFIN